MTLTLMISALAFAIGTARAGEEDERRLSRVLLETVLQYHPEVSRPPTWPDALRDVHADLVASERGFHLGVEGNHFEVMHDWMKRLLGRPTRETSDVRDGSRSADFRGCVLVFNAGRDRTVVYSLAWSRGPSRAVGCDRGRVVPVKTPAPVYPPELKAFGIEGSAVLSFVVDERGRVVDASAVSYSDPAFACAALDAVAGWELRPVFRDGAPVRTQVRQRFLFELDSFRSAEASAAPTARGLRPKRHHRR